MEQPNKEITQEKKGLDKSTLISKRVIWDEITAYIISGFFLATAILCWQSYGILPAIGWVISMFWHWRAKSLSEMAEDWANEARTANDHLLKFVVHQYVDSIDSIKSKNVQPQGTKKHNTKKHRNKMGRHK